MTSSRHTMSIVAFAWVMLLLVVLAAGWPHDANANRHTVQASGRDAAAVNYIYWTDSGSDQILRAKPGGSPEVLLNNQPDPRGISLDLNAGHMYWADRELRQILRANLDGSGRVILRNYGSGPGRPNMLALDLGAGKMYWTDNQLDTINRANLDGSQPEVLLDSGDGVDGPIGIALDLVNGKMYWVEFANRRIRRANLDGSAVENLVTTGLSQPLEIALDVNGGKMYWTDDGAGVIAVRRANLNGTNVENLVTAANGLSNPRGIALDLAAGKMYWLDWGAKRMQTANLNGGGMDTLFTASDGLSNPLSLALDLTSSPTCYLLTTNHSGVGSDPVATPNSSPGCSNGRYLAGASLSLTAAPAVGWRVDGWSGTNNNSSTAESNTATMPAANHTVSVQYVEIPVEPTCYRLTLNHTGLGADPVASPASSTGCGNGRYEAGTVIALTAAPAIGWRVDGWNGTDNNTSTAVNNTVTMPAADRTVTVDYVEVPPECFALLRGHSGSGADPVATPPSSGGCAAGHYLAGTAITLTAAPSAGWEVAGWLGTDNNASAGLTNSLTMPAQEHTVRVTYVSSSFEPRGGLYLPLIAFECYHTIGETLPNSSIGEAFGPLCLGATMFGRADDRDDYFSFDLTAPTAVMIALPGPRSSNIQQLHLYRGSVANRIAFAGGEPYEIGCHLQPGRYYIRVISVEPFSNNETYRLTLNLAQNVSPCG